MVSLGAITMDAGDYVLVANTGGTYTGLASATCSIVDAAGFFGLGNSGETILLNDSTTVMDSVTYDDAAPWATTPDGGGPSLEKILPGLPNSAEFWGPSTVDNGSPCAANTAVAETKISATGHSPWAPAPGETVTYKATVSDPVNTVTSVNVTISQNGFATNTTYEMADANSDGTWELSLGTSSTAGTTVSYAIKAGNDVGGTISKYNAFMNYTIMADNPYISAFHAQAVSGVFENNSFVAITNPGDSSVDITGWYLSDEANAGNFFGSIGSFDSVWQFPASSSIAAGATIFVAVNGSAFEADYDMVADFETNGTSAAPNLTKLDGGSSQFDLYRGGEEIILVGPGAVVDAMMYQDWQGVSFDGNGFLSVHDSIQGTFRYSMAASDTDDPATDFSSEVFPFMMVVNSVDGALHDGGDVLNLVMFDKDGLSHSWYNWDDGTNTTMAGATTSVTVPAGGEDHVLNLYANDTLGNSAHISYSFKGPGATSSSTPTSSAPTSSTPTTSTTTPTSSTTKDDDGDDGFIPGFEMWIAVMSITALITIRRRFKK
jgi:hypothetical protein